MGVLKSTVTAIDNYLRRSGGRDQGTRPDQAFRDAGMEAGSFSVEAQAAQALSDLALGGFQFQMTGSSERARILDRAADEFDRRHAVPVMEHGMLWGDCIVVPVWDGERFDHAVVDVCDFRILGCRGDEITHVAYVVERKTVGTQQYALVQEMRLVERAGETSAEMRLTALSQSGSAVDMARFPTGPVTTASGPSRAPGTCPSRGTAARSAGPTPRTACTAPPSATGPRGRSRRFTTWWSSSTPSSSCPRSPSSPTSRCSRAATGPCPCRAARSACSCR